MYNNTYYLNNKNKYKLASKKYLDKNRSFFNLYQAFKKQFKRYPSLIKSSLEETKQWFNLQEKKCVFCGDVGNSVDHKIPLNRGGLHEISNLQITCFPCNKMKGTMLPEEFLERIRKINDLQQGS